VISFYIIGIHTQHQHEPRPAVAATRPQEEHSTAAEDRLLGDASCTDCAPRARSAQCDHLQPDGEQTSRPSDCQPRLRPPGCRREGPSEEDPPRADLSDGAEETLRKPRRPGSDPKGRRLEALSRQLLADEGSRVGRVAVGRDQDGDEGARLRPVQVRRDDDTGREEQPGHRGDESLRVGRRQRQFGDVRVAEHGHVLLCRRFCGVPRVMTS